MKFVKRLQESLENNYGLNAYHINEKYYTYLQFSEKISEIRLGISRNIKKSEKRIGLVTNDDIETYAAIIALWFEGKAYVPINPLSPMDRNIQLLNLTDTIYVIDSSKKSIYASEFCVINSNTQEKTAINLEPNSFSKEDIAYILFTSGSTGTPKGVPITFSNLNGLVEALDADSCFNLNSMDRCLQMFELTFDFSIVGYLPPLLFGACLYTIPKDAIKYFYIYKLLIRHKLTVLTMVPSIIHYLRPYFNEIEIKEVRYCSFGGGKLYEDIAEEWSKCIPKAQIFNYYGPTEYTVYSSYYLYNKKERNKNKNGIISIGKPLNGVDCLIVDELHNELSAGEIGELCLSGVQLTPGYWKDEEKSRNSFFNKVRNEIEKRYYKTGDLCYMDSDGDYMYVGRTDFQVKIRGYRVELGEVEFYAKEKLPKTDLIALDIKNYLGNTELAIAILADEFDTSELLSYMKIKLPNYMLPSQFLFLKEFPYNINGKIDRNALRALLKSMQV